MAATANRYAPPGNAEIGPALERNDGVALLMAATARTGAAERRGAWFPVEQGTYGIGKEVEMAATDRSGLMISVHP